MEQILKQINEQRLHACTDQSLLLQRDSGLDNLQFIHHAVPDIDFADVSTNAMFLGRELQAPFLISSVASNGALDITRNLALAAEENGIALILGPAGIALYNESYLNELKVRDLAPSIPLFTQLEICLGDELLSTDDALKIISSLDADGLVIRLNIFESALFGLSPRSKGIFKQIKAISNALQKKNIPTIISEIGFGLDLAASRALIESEIDALSVLGAGTISPAKCAEKLTSDVNNERVGHVFGDWGLNMVDSIRQIKAVSQQIPLIAGGGVRHGLDAAKILALGSDMVSLTSPFMAAGQKSQAAVNTLCKQLRKELQLTMFAVGVKNLDELRSGRRLRPKV